MAADQAVHCTGADVALSSPVLVPYAEAGAGDDGQMLGGMGLLIPAVERLVQLDGILNAHEGIDADAVAIPDEADGVVRRHDAIHGVAAFRKEIKRNGFHYSIPARGMTSGRAGEYTGNTTCL